MLPVPLHDDNPTVLRPVVTVAVIVVCVIVFLWQQGLPPPARHIVAVIYGAVPGVIFGTVSLPPDLQDVPPLATLVTSIFLHGGWMHLIGNMLYLWVFGNNVEDSMGHGRFIAFFLACGALAAGAHAMTVPESRVPMIGASGAISGVLGAYLLLYPKARILVFFWFIIFFRTWRIPAGWVLGAWIGVQIVNYALSDPERAGVAFMAHIAGFGAGMALLPLFKKRHIPLFRGRSGPWG
jgi:membrane associated rhomboid family serine protease